MTRQLTVVIVTWNGRELLDACLGSLETQTLARDLYRVVVVDNASTDGTPEHVRSRWPDVRLVVADENLGFAGGCNLGLAGLSTPYAVLLNNDARARPEFLEALLTELDAPGNERVGAVTGQVLLEGRFRRDDAGRWQPADDGDILVNSTGNEVRTDGFGQDRSWLEVAPVDVPSEVFGFCGAAAALRRDALEDVGLFDDDFFLYYEDTDLSWRLRLAGWQIRYAPGAVVDHVHAASSDEGSRLFRTLNDRNRLLTLVKNAPAGLALAAVARYPATALSIRLRADDGMSAARAEAYLSFLRLAPRMLARRRRHSGQARRGVARLLVAPTPSRERLRQ